MRRSTSQLLVAAHLMVLALPLWATLRPERLPGRPLDGAVEPKPWPKLSWSALLDEKLQHGLDAWYEDHIGVKKLVVRLDNTLTLHLLGESGEGSRVRVGSDDTLFVDEDVDYLTASRVPDPALLSRAAASLARAQAVAAAQGRPLVGVVVPAKTSIFPERVPARLRREIDPALPVERHYRAFLDAAEAAGAVVIDARALGLAMRAAGEPTFPPGGRHWNRLYVCRVVERVLVAAPPLAALLPDPDCTVVGMERLHIDLEEQDLWRLLNVWGGPPPSYLSPLLVERPAPERRLRRALVVGSSFVWKVQEDFVRNHWFEEIDVFYYNRTHYRWVDGEVKNLGPIDPAGAAWRRVIDEAALYLIDLPEMFMVPEYVDFLDQLAARVQGAGAE